MAQVPPFDFSLDEIREELNRIRHPFRVAIRRSKNPFNIGALIRTAHSFLAQEIILIGTDSWYRRGAMGMQRYENIVEIESESAFVQHAKEEGWHLSSLEKDNATVGLWDATMPTETVIVIGNENEGVGEEILAASDEIVAIPMFGINHSYPMTVAGGIAMAEWARRHYAGEGRVVVTPRQDQHREQATRA